MDRPARPAQAPPVADTSYCDPPPFRVRAQGLDLAFYPAGRDRRARLLELIGQAKLSLKLAFYTFMADDIGTEVRDALVAAARRGVEVSLIVDGFGTPANEEFFAPIEQAGGCFCCFIPHWSVRYLIRNHQKIFIADDRIAMLGGFNIEDAYFDPPEVNGWNDIGFTVEGPLVERVAAWFAELEQWTRDPHAPFRAIRRKVRGWNPGGGTVQLLIGGPTTGLSSWARSVGGDLIHGERLDLMMAYFAPPPRLQRRIRAIAAKGETRLILAGKSDNAATIGAARALYRKLLKCRARIYEFQPCKLHTKLIVLDDAVYLGSANFDMRSLYLNLEIVVRIEDAALAERMRRFVAEHVPASLEVTPELHARQATWWNRIRWRASWFLVAVLDYTVARRLNLGL